MNVFLSASVPLPTRNERYYSTADVVGIREAVKALLISVLPQGTIVFGGHPAITPMASILTRELFPNRIEHLVLYQSLEFEGRFPPEVLDFSRVTYTSKSEAGQTDSLRIMRERMIGDYIYDAAIFIGGMEGVVEEFEMFKAAHPKAKLLPLASTGAAALEIFNSGEFDPDFRDDSTYSTIFRRKLFDML
jgi:SLOG cluster3 family